MRWRAAQPFGLLALILWGLGIWTARVDAGLGDDLLVHDTYLSSGANHLWPFLVLALLVAGLLDLDRRDIGWPGFLGAVSGAIVLGIGMGVVLIGFAQLGVEGMPRRFYGHTSAGSSGRIHMSAILPRRTRRGRSRGTPDRRRAKRRGTDRPIPGGRP